MGHFKLLVTMWNLLFEKLETIGRNRYLYGEALRCWWLALKCESLLDCSAQDLPRFQRDHACSPFFLFCCWLSRRSNESPEGQKKQENNANLRPSLKACVLRRPDRLGSVKIFFRKRKGRSTPKMTAWRPSQYLPFSIYGPSSTTS